MTISKRPVAAVLVFASLWVALGWIANGQAAPDGQSFAMLVPGFSQRLFGVVSEFVVPGAYLGGIAVLQNGDVIAAECLSSNARLHRFQANATIPGTTLHVDTPMNSEGGCGIVVHPDGFLYSNRDGGPMVPGVVKIDPATGQTVRAMGPAGNALGIAVDPKTDHLVYAGRDCRAGLFGPTCTLFDLDPETGKAEARVVFNSNQVGYIGGIYFDPSGEFIFLNNRFPSPTLTIIRRNDQIVQHVDMPFGIDATGVAFHSSGRFIVTNNTDGTMTRFRFRAADEDDLYEDDPEQDFFAAGGFRGDLTQVGPDGCVYVTQAGTRYDDFTETAENSVVRICGAGTTFVPPRGIELNTPPAADLRITASAPASVAGGDQFSYSFVALNAGEGTASDVAITHALPDKTALISLVAPAGWTCLTTSSGSRGTVTCTKPSMAPGESAMLALRAGVDCLSSSIMLPISATVTSSTADANPGDNTASVATRVAVVPLTITNISVQPVVLWPPNHKTIEAMIDYDVSGGCGGDVKTKLSIRTNEKADPKDTMVVDGRRVRIDATRRGNGTGRIYTVTIIATDGAATATANVEIVVPHDMGNNKGNPITGGKQ